MGDGDLKFKTKNDFVRANFNTSYPLINSGEANVTWQKLAAYLLYVSALPNFLPIQQKKHRQGYAKGVRQVAMTICLFAFRRKSNICFT